MKRLRQTRPKNEFTLDGVSVYFQRPTKEIENLLYAPNN
jgi:hypothetical protein